MPGQKYQNPGLSQTIRDVWHVCPMNTKAPITSINFSNVIQDNNCRVFQQICILGKPESVAGFADLLSLSETLCP